MNSQFFCLLRESRLCEIDFSIPVDAHLADLSCVVSRDVLGRARLELAKHLVGVTFCQIPIFQNIHERAPLSSTPRIDVQFVGRSHGVLVIEHIVEAKTTTCIVILVFDSQVFPYIHERLAIKFIVVVLVLAELKQSSIQSREDIQPTIPIRQVKHFPMVVLVVAFIRLSVLQAKSFPLLFGGLDFDDRIVGGIIFCPRFRDDFHILDVG